jgi:ribonuclease HI
MFPKMMRAQKKYIKIFPEYVYKLKFNGYNQNNTGLSGCGIVIYKNDIEVWANSYFIEDKKIDNYAEYIALILGLHKAYFMNISHIMVESDNLPIINHMKGLHSCDSEGLMELYCRAKELESRFDNVSFTHIFKNDNKRACELSNVAIKNYLLDLK